MYIPSGTQMYGTLLTSINLDLKVGISACEQQKRTADDNARSVWHGPKPIANRLPGSQPRNLHGWPLAGPVDNGDGASVNVIVRRPVRLRWLSDDPVAGSALCVDDGGIQDVRAEGGDV